MNELCNCGLPIRYTHSIDGKLVGSCNKYNVCLTWIEQDALIRKLTASNNKYYKALSKIVHDDLIDFEYKAIAYKAII